MALTETAFTNLAEETLEHFLDALDEHLADHVEADLDGGNLTIDLEDGGHYILNLHRPNRQIWMSSPKSGASHYGYDEASGHWVCTRGGGDLEERLGKELAEATGEDFTF